MMLFVSNRFVASVDEQSLSREQEVVTNGLAGFQSEIGHRVVPQAVWDEAVINLDNRFSPEWAEENIGLFPNQTAGFEETFVLDTDNRVVFASDAGTTVLAPCTTATPDAVEPIVARLRRGTTRGMPRRTSAAIASCRPYRPHPSRG